MIISLAHTLHLQLHSSQGELILISPVDEAAFFFQPRLMHEPYARFKVLSPEKQIKSITITIVEKKGAQARRGGGVSLNWAHAQQGSANSLLLYITCAGWFYLHFS